ncbi:hypothetical protein GCM10009848_54690 [Micromonospora lupini]
MPGLLEVLAPDVLAGGGLAPTIPKPVRGAAKPANQHRVAGGRDRGPSGMLGPRLVGTRYCGTVHRCALVPLQP